jgi:hypothetical protein
VAYYRGKKEAIEQKLCGIMSPSYDSIYCGEGAERECTRHNKTELYTAERASSKAGNGAVL